MNHLVDAVMAVMEVAFDPAFGEAWTRRQVADSLIMPSTHVVLSGLAKGDPIVPARVTGFTMSRQVLDEEELLLIAVRPECRGRGVGRELLRVFFAEAEARGSRRFFLEMRDGNPAEVLYRTFDFQQVGRRRAYYRSASGGPLDAITFAKKC